MQGFPHQEELLLATASEADNARGKRIIKSAHPFVLLSNHSQLERKHGPVTVKGPPPPLPECYDVRVPMVTFCLHKRE